MIDAMIEFITVAIFMALISMGIIILINKFFFRRVKWYDVFISEADDDLIKNIEG